MGCSTCEYFDDTKEVVCQCPEMSLESKEEMISQYGDNCPFIFVIGKLTSSKTPTENQLIEKHLKEIIVTTTNHIDGYRVKKYIDIESVEIVLGTGIFSEVTAGVGDIFGLRSSAYEGKLSNAKKTAMNLLKYNAYKKDGNAVIGIDIDYTEFSGNRVGLIINGTIVKIEPIT